MKKKLIINGENTFVLSETLSKVLNEINIIKSQNTAVAVNEEVVEKINWENYKIKSGDIIEIVQPLKGG
jgi:thiamine biosynthesis protein ThiS